MTSPKRRQDLPQRVTFQRMHIAMLPKCPSNHNIDRPDLVPQRPCNNATECFCSLSCSAVDEDKVCLRALAGLRCAGAIGAGNIAPKPNADES